MLRRSDGSGGHAMAQRKGHRLPVWERMLYAIPFIGWMIKDVVHGESDNIYHFLAGMVFLWIILGIVFGYPGIIIPALVFTPVILFTLLLITRG
jgi:hypothetical protein